MRRPDWTRWPLRDYLLLAVVMVLAALLSYLTAYLLASKFINN